MHIIGIDPGPTTGIVRLTLSDPPRALLAVDALQVTQGVVLEVLEALFRAGPWDRADYVHLAMERFVVGPRAARSSTAHAGATTRALITEVSAWAETNHHPVSLRSAAQVKPWAGLSRLDAIGLVTLTPGMGHARDAGRHALYCAVLDYGLPDPLSRRSVSVALEDPTPDDEGAA